MEFFGDLNQKVKKFSFFDIKMIQFTTLFAALILVKLVPEILKVNIWWFVALLIVCLVKPLFVFFQKR
jgi:hypothetical protein